MSCVPSHQTQRGMQIFRTVVRPKCLWVLSPHELGCNMKMNLRFVRGSGDGQSHKSLLSWGEQVGLQGKGFGGSDGEGSLLCEHNLEFCWCINNKTQASPRVKCQHCGAENPWNSYRQSVLGSVKCRSVKSSQTHLHTMDIRVRWLKMGNIPNDASYARPQII